MKKEKKVELKMEPYIFLSLVKIVIYLMIHITHNLYTYITLISLCIYTYKWTHKIQKWKIILVGKKMFKI